LSALGYGTAESRLRYARKMNFNPEFRELSTFFGLTRIFHRVSPDATQSGMSAALRLFGLLDISSNMPPQPSSHPRPVAPTERRNRHRISGLVENIAQGARHKSCRHGKQASWDRRRPRLRGKNVLRAFSPQVPVSFPALPGSGLLAAFPGL